MDYKLAENLGKILAATTDLYMSCEMKQGVFFLPPHPKPDFMTMQELMRNVGFSSVDAEVKNRADNIREAIHALRDRIAWSEQSIAFDPLKGFGIKHHAPTGKVEVTRYKSAREVIDITGQEVYDKIEELKGTNG